MISAIEFCPRHRWMVSRHPRLNFSKGLNAVIGPNGTGKSTLLKAIKECADCRKTEDNGTAYLYYNSETMNPHRSQDHLKGPLGAKVKVRSQYSSHGETMRDVLSTLNFKEGDCFLFDEPEGGLDLPWVLKLREGIWTLCRQGCQFIVASHHPAFWQGEDVRRIELEEGYREKCRKAFEGFWK
ncbi:MAG: ABC transporter ATP-binding protein [Candidatus Omnitrophota bacterium]|nr:ABC transporter ATP-binding protein [Candidatus Omnitrophota bacterium]MDZ4243312.1 ABC transporter ATP-binding protein [Candidatus Omnitrophota bacterium]